MFICMCVCIFPSSIMSPIFVCLCLLVFLLFTEMFTREKNLVRRSSVCLFFVCYVFVFGAILCLLVCVFASFLPLSYV